MASSEPQLILWASCYRGLRFDDLIETQVGDLSEVKSFGMIAGRQGEWGVGVP